MGKEGGDLDKTKKKKLRTKPLFLLAPSMARCKLESVDSIARLDFLRGMGKSGEGERVEKKERETFFERDSFS